MKAFVSATYRYAVDPRGELWTPDNSCAYDFWTRYLDVFDEVRIVVRARPCQAPPEGWNQATGPGVVAAPVPDYHTPWELLRDTPTVRHVIRATLDEAPAMILRIPCQIGSMARQIEQRRRHPYGVEVIGDPYEALAPGTIKHKLRPFYRRWLARGVRQACAGACGAAYVTSGSLQRRYPAAPDAHSTHYSSVRLPDSAVVDRPRQYCGDRRPLRLICIGTLRTLYKAPHILIDAVGECVKDGLDLTLTFLGDGQHRAELEQQVASAGLADRIRFLGHVVSADDVRSELDRSDVFVLPSLSEGLPRAMIEAMARALPCIGSNVGGIPELLEPDEMIPPGNVEQLAAKIREYADSPARLIEMSARNLRKADDYRDSILKQRRIAFYEHVRDRTAQWLARRNECRDLSAP